MCFSRAHFFLKVFHNKKGVGNAHTVREFVMFKCFPNEVAMCNLMVFQVD